MTNRARRDVGKSVGKTPRLAFGEEEMDASTGLARQDAIREELALASGALVEAEPRRRLDGISSGGRGSRHTFVALPLSRLVLRAATRRLDGLSRWSCSFDAQTARHAMR